MKARASFGDSLRPLIPIERRDGSIVEELRSVADWRQQKTGAGELADIDWDDVVENEPHHRSYGRPWILGRLYFDALKGFGVRPSDKVLDLGCGVGRAGVWLIPYLEPGRYFGVDNHLRSLAVFSGYEALLHDLAPRRPRLLHDPDFAVESFGECFDVVLDLFTLAHLPPERQAPALERIGGSCRTGARLFSLQPLPDQPRWRATQSVTIGPNDWRIFTLEGDP